MKRTEYQQYPEQPRYKNSCPVNMYYSTLPTDHPRSMQVLGPASCAKRLYSNKPNHYPMMTRQIPCNTLYGENSGRNTIYGNVSTKLYPFTDRTTWEIREYSNNILPYPWKTT